MAELFGEKAEVSLGTVAAPERRTSKAPRPAYDEALNAIPNADFVDCDETYWRQSNGLVWLWAAVTPLLKVFRIDKRRNREAFRRLLFAFDGIFGTDLFLVNQAHDPKERQLCWAHPLRSFRGLKEAGGKARSPGRAGQEIVKAVFKEWYRFREGKLTRGSPSHRLAPRLPPPTSGPINPLPPSPSTPPKTSDLSDTLSLNRWRIPLCDQARPSLIP